MGTSSAEHNGAARKRLGSAPNTDAASSGRQAAPEASLTRKEKKDSEWREKGR